MVDVALTREEAGPADVTAVIDVLRATSTIVQALGSGYQRVLCADGLDRARELAGPGRVLAGEERCVPPPDFELGNSPGDTVRPRGPELVLATTNGAPAIVLAAGLSPVVLVAALLNLDAVLAALEGERDVQLLCAGTDGGVSIEDTYLAGRIAARLPKPHSEAALIACAVARSFPDPLAALRAGKARLLLEASGLGSDVDWCARESTIAIVPRVNSLADAGVAVVTAHSQTPMIKDKKIAGTLSLASVLSRLGDRTTPPAERTNTT